MRKVESGGFEEEERGGFVDFGDLADDEPREDPEFENLAAPLIKYRDLDALRVVIIFGALAGLEAVSFSCLFVEGTLFWWVCVCVGADEAGG